MILALIAAAAAVSAPRASLGVWSGWGAFQTPALCWAVAEPAGTRRVTRPFASIARAPGRGAQPSLWVRLSSAADRSVVLSVGERRFVLPARGAAAWSDDPASARALVAALRGERSMSIAWIGPNGRPHADVYLLAGAATAIDAAALACLHG